MSRLTVGSIEGLTENSNVVSVPTGHSLNVADAGGLQIGGSAVVSPGLVHISRTAIGTAVSSVTVTGAFSADYDNYRITANGSVGSTAQALALKLGASTTTYNQVFRYYTYSGSATTVTVNNGSVWTHAGEALVDNISMNVDLQSPFLAKYTAMSGFYSGSVAGWVTGYHGTATSYTDFTISVAGTLTGGTIDVYGYAKA